MIFSRILNRFHVFFDNEVLYYKFISVNKSGTSEINVIRNMLYPIVGKSDHDSICHVLQNNITKTSLFGMGEIMHNYQLDYQRNTLFYNDFLKLKRDEREYVFDTMYERNCIRCQDIKEDKLKLKHKNKGHKKLLRICQKQLIELENLNNILN